MSVMKNLYMAPGSYNKTVYTPESTANTPNPNTNEDVEDATDRSV